MYYFTYPDRLERWSGQRCPDNRGSTVISITVPPSDPSYSFDSILFYGNCWNLWLLDVLVFAVVDLVSHNFVLAAVITYILTRVSG